MLPKHKPSIKPRANSGPPAKLTSRVDSGPLLYVVTGPDYFTKDAFFLFQIFLVKDCTFHESNIKIL